MPRLLRVEYENTYFLELKRTGNISTIAKFKLRMKFDHSAGAHFYLLRQSECSVAVSHERAITPRDEVCCYRPKTAGNLNATRYLLSIITRPHWASATGGSLRQPEPSSFQNPGCLQPNLACIPVPFDQTQQSFSTFANGEVRSTRTCPRSPPSGSTKLPLGSGSSSTESIVSAVSGSRPASVSASLISSAVQSARACGAIRVLPTCFAR